MKSVTHRHWQRKGEFVEECTIRHEGRCFSARGAEVGGGRATGYLHQADGGAWYLGGFDGRRLGACQITATWRTPRSSLSDIMVQAKCKIDGVWYIGRGAGDGMLWRGKRRKAS